MTKTDLTVKLSNWYSRVREKAIEKLLKLDALIKDPWYAQRNSSGSIKTYDGYMKMWPQSNSTSYINKFVALLFEFNIYHNDYSLSYNNVKPFKTGENNHNLSRILDRADIRQTTWTFSAELEKTIANSTYLSERIKLNPDSVLKPDNLTTCISTQNSTLKSLVLFNSFHF